jgi:hypothetical protein
MNIFPFVLFIIVAALILVYFLRSKLDREGQGSYGRKRNDKLVVVKGIDYAGLKQVLLDFCKMYNKRGLQAIVRLTTIDETAFAITFPFDIEFEIFCYFINYLQYPVEFKSIIHVIAWTTTKTGDPWITAKSANKNVMLFIPPDDTEHDNVFLTTADNTGYKLRFALGENELLLEMPAREYTPPPIGIDILAGQQFEDFK